jgi:anoctamin-1
MLVLGYLIIILIYILDILIICKKKIDRVIFKWWNHVRIMTATNEQKEVVFNTQWAKDLKLLEWGDRSLFPEYLEMILQYGFVTIFVAAFPLAPLFALCNNVLEMRFDAKKLITYYRRPVGQRVKDIGIWYGIMDTLGKLAVISNVSLAGYLRIYLPIGGIVYDHFDCRPSLLPSHLILFLKWYTELIMVVR